MPSNAEATFTLPFTARAPLSMLLSRRLRLSFPLPTPLLRALGPDAPPSDTTLWSAWLADLGWTWAVSADHLQPTTPLLEHLLAQGCCSTPFDRRVLALAFALRMKVDGIPLIPDTFDTALNLERVWQALVDLPRTDLEQTLALALLQHDPRRPVFELDPIAPDWHGDVSRVFNERRALRDQRAPGPIWLDLGYELMAAPMVELRSLGTDVAACTEIWEAFARERAVPEAFRMAFWWEAVYCLTEHHAHAEAAQAQRELSDIVDTLETTSGLITPLWHHQKGRLFYYVGNLEAALQAYVAEYRVHGHDPRVGAMVQRELANVLSDLACPEAAEQFAQQSVTLARQQGQEAERYKSLGRLGEIALKRGDPSTARHRFLESLAIQDTLTDENRSPAQTLTYLGHAALLSSDFAAAETYYDQATERDRHHQAARPYLLMGRFALARATGNRQTLARLWLEHGARIEVDLDHTTHVLPAAVCIRAAAGDDRPAPALRETAVRALIDRLYLVEAACLAFDLPEPQRAPLLADCVEGLTRWRKALKSLPDTVRRIAGPLNGPALCIEAIRERTMPEQPAILSLCYPMTLIPPGRENA